MDATLPTVLTAPASSEDIPCTTSNVMTAQESTPWSQPRTGAHRACKKDLSVIKDDQQWSGKIHELVVTCAWQRVDIAPKQAFPGDLRV